MSQQKEEKKDRIQVNDLTPEEEELKAEEAREVKGNGGVSGGVLRSGLGEELSR